MERKKNLIERQSEALDEVLARFSSVAHLLGIGIPTKEYFVVIPEKDPDGLSLVYRAVGGLYWHQWSEINGRLFNSYNPTCTYQLLQDREVTYAQLRQGMDSLLAGLEERWQRERDQLRRYLDDLEDPRLNLSA